MLDAVHHISDGRCGNLSAEVSLPKLLTVARIQGEEVALAIAGEEHIARRGKDAGIAHVAHLIIPDLLSGLRIQSAHHAITPTLVPLDEWLPLDRRKRTDRRTTGEGFAR